MRRSFALFVVGFAACGTAPSGPALTFDPCSAMTLAAPAATAGQLASIDGAIAMWHARGVVGPVRGPVTGDGPAVAVEFRDAASSIYGYYDDTTATIYVNTRVTDPSARAITIAHELGHALALAHVAAATRASVMNPGNLTIAPNEADASELEVMWGGCPAAP